MATKLNSEAEGLAFLSNMKTDLQKENNNGR